MKYLNQFNIFTMIVIFSVTASFGQGWKILTTQEFTNIIGKKIKNNECSFKFEKGGI